MNYLHISINVIVMAAIYTKYSLPNNTLSFITKAYKNTIFFGPNHIVRNIFNQKTNNEAFDIIVVGGGMVGTTLACALANNKCLQSKKILLLEAGNKQKYVSNDQYSNRVVALNKYSKLLLSNIGAWKHIQSHRFTPIVKMQIWDAYSDAMLTFNDDYLSQALAYIVENDLLLHAVHTQLSKKKSVTIINNAKVEHINLSNNIGIDSNILLKSGENFKAKLLIGADGQMSKVRDAMGVKYVDWDYDQMGIVATVKLCETIENVAWQRFLPNGTIALLPLTNSLCSLVWCITTEEAKRLLQISEEEFIDNLNDAFLKVYPKDELVKCGMQAFKKLFENFQLPSAVSRQLQPSIAGIVDGSRAAFPLGFGHALHYVQPGVALVGDAAHRVNPLAGQGVNLGFGDVTVLVEVLAKAVNNGALIGDTTYLHNYESIRLKYNIPTMLTIDALHRLYKTTASPIILARSLGLQLTNIVKPLKNFLIKHAAGTENI
ncbi:PREDICTED: putative ubiquinone biosynthesis monooxygenase COQ6 [Ceratosolen solmsi marchali]|uniref:Ubiquinone biosynthesis monooxygenase COQ6, mitochondrial n=1 Tax=Ceratosolen solmsi marchali TaxID=326594 RepID=A0AAJ6YVW2_9HYME|nr:PREDICTED: putative ubiquinone biosynthesis monooxygenase COQ6 [Ceratosolen solmsi marchali]